tara:strand:- start:6145 stop:6936 length:792 start_codon:yes stop_codon:yes gene_type:complete
MNLNIKNKVAFVGGSSKGIGKGIALQLAKEGANIILCARNKLPLEKVAKLIKKEYKVDVLQIPVDLSDINALKHAVQQSLAYFKHIDILVVNSGGPKPGRFFELNDDDWEIAYRSVLLYAIELYKLIIPLMKKKKWGRIINITSLSVKEPNESLVLSNVFRSGITSLAKSLSTELYENGITINNVCPGAFKTDRTIELINNKAISDGKTVEEIEEELTKRLPRKEFSSIQDIGNLVAFLSSDASKEITGATIQIDKGMYKGLF